ncbi:MAG TPA: tetratricopeptide repeat protein [Ktedonobacteraceae bacterium]|nr:tetratricopeptide repeat protein [Ktedonobacteraceae bacterium]
MEDIQVDNQVLLNRARLRLEEGQPESAREVLERIHPENTAQQQEVDYLRAWGYVLEASWEEAEAILACLVETIEAEAEDNDEIQTNEHRKRHALCRFYLGNVAVNIGRYDDAARHYTRCIRLLQDRRIQTSKLQPIRVRARYYLGMTCIERGLYSAARQYYEESLKLFEGVLSSSEGDWREDLANIYYGLCNLSWKSGKLIDALEMGKTALNLYKELDMPIMVSRMHNHLGHVYRLLGEFREASDQFTNSLAIATACENPRMIMLNCSALAKLRMDEGRLKEAREYADLSLSFTRRFQNNDLIGQAYLTVGIVAQAEAEQLSGARAHERMEEALRYFEQACNLLDETQAYGLIAEAYGKRAELLEMLGRTQEAVVCWRSAVKAQGDSYGTAWN